MKRPPELAKLYAAVVAFEQEAAVEGALAALAAGFPAGDLVARSLAPAMEEVGRLYDQGHYFVPELLLASDSFEAALSVLSPHLAEGGGAPKGRLLLGTVAGDIHEIGKNLVGLMFRSAGWRVRDLGANVSADQFAQASLEFRPHLMGLSSLMTTSFQVMPAMVAALRRAAPTARIMVGGASLTMETARRLGADGYAPNAAAAVREGQRLLGT